MDCLVLPVSSILRRRSSLASRLGYEQLAEEESQSPVRVVVGKDKTEFLVDPFVLEESPFRVLIEMMRKQGHDDGYSERAKGRGKRNRVIYVDVDAILFEHMLWLMHNDCSSLFQLNLEEVIDFYALDS